ncbi:unnamed protein product [Orchesella dallaii]|uniref:DUF4789 domain-containing protein n=1 Tax=Orchesella dallaii TaxID=48710 RepID=A0ABP1QR12_9HEXA
MKYYTISRMVERHHATLSFSIIVIIIELTLLSGFAYAIPMQLVFPDSVEVEVTTNNITNGKLCEKPKYYHNETKSCWPTSPRKRGPCPESMIFYAVDKIYGDCDCPEASVSAVYVYDVSSNQCFKTYNQAFCPPNEWLILDNNSIPTCVPNSCQKFQRGTSRNEHEDRHVVLFKNKCVTVLDSDPDVCPYPYEITIDLDKGLPICSSDLPETTEYDLGVKGSFKCRTGTRRDRLGKCRPTNNKDKE